MTDTTIVKCENYMNCENKNGENPNIELSQSLASDNLSIVNRNEEQQIIESGLSLAAVGMSENNNETERFMSKSEYEYNINWD